MDYLLYGVSLLRDKGYISKISKTSILGYLYDKTIDYYIGNLVVSPIDDKYFIEYITKDSKKYTIACPSEFYHKAHDYINGLPERVISSDDKILSAYEIDSDKSYKDITSKVKEFYGPRRDFYTSTEFNVIKEYITLKELCIIDTDFIVHKFFDNDEIVSI